MSELEQAEGGGLDTGEQQCHYCKQWFPFPVELHHHESDCVRREPDEVTKPAAPDGLDATQRAERNADYDLEKYIENLEDRAAEGGAR